MRAGLGQAPSRPDASAQVIAVPARRRSPAAARCKAAGSPQVRHWLRIHGCGPLLPVPFVLVPPSAVDVPGERGETRIYREFVYRSVTGL
jgi:hypothetical protein